MPYMYLIKNQPWNPMTIFDKLAVPHRGVRVCIPVLGVVRNLENLTELVCLMLIMCSRLVLRCSGLQIRVEFHHTCLIGDEVSVFISIYFTLCYIMLRKIALEPGKEE